MKRVLTQDQFGAEFVVSYQQLRAAHWGHFKTGVWGGLLCNLAAGFELKFAHELHSTLLYVFGSAIAVACVFMNRLVLRSYQHWKAMDRVCKIGYQACTVRTQTAVNCELEQLHAAVRDYADL